MYVEAQYWNIGFVENIQIVNIQIVNITLDGYIWIWFSAVDKVEGLNDLKLPW